MILTDLRLRNFRCFEDLQLDFNDKLTVLVANNGHGKTTILDAIAIAFGPFLTRLPKVKGKDFGDGDLRIKENGKPAPFQAIAARIFVDDERIEWTRFVKRDQSAWTEREIQIEQDELTAKNIYDLSRTKNQVGELTRYADRFIEAYHEDRPHDLPILAYYGTGRGVFSVPARRTGFQKNFERFDAYHGCLDPKTNFRKFFEYFYFLEDYENRQIKDRRDSEFRHGELEVIRKAITTFLKDFSNPRTELSALPIFLDRKTRNSVKTFDIRTFSDGYRTSLGVVMDLASRMAEANPHLGVAALNAKGIVLIDEIDMHLHPEWQQRIIQDLQRTFPNLQFICTTHSPQLLSTVSKENIRMIVDCHRVEKPGQQTRGVASNDILMRIMDVDPTPAVKEAAMLSKLKALIQSGELDAEQARLLRRELSEHFGEGHPELLECDRLIRLEAFKRKIASKQ